MPDRRHRHLFYYADMDTRYGWFATLGEFRASTGATWGVRCCAPDDALPPAGYRKTGRGLANDPAERIPTMGDFVEALTPKKARRG